ncbi:Embryogenesis-associated protein EMB8 [Durusdinium trenchii]|uniref:Embryogenesis-associated protein EMB8 n=1 Tax=Durusdinium trenchii TaxID=1381693 RepID=A0ABP0KL43_9DINO
MSAALWRTAVLPFVVVMLVRWYRALRERVRLAHHPEKNHPVLFKWMAKSKVLREGYRPPAWWSIGSQFLVGSLHTVYHHIARNIVSPVEQVCYDRELFKLECGATVGLDWAMKVGDLEAPCRHDSSKPIVFLHHGLAGCSRSHYVQSIIAQLLEHNAFRVVVMVARGCGGVPLTTPYGFTAAGYDDMRQVAEHLRSENPDAKMYAVGYSLGAGLLANYLGRSSTDCVFSGAVVVSPCWDFHKTTPYFEVWSRAFLAIHTPTLALSADDDPVCSVEGADIMTEKNHFGPGLLIARTNRGGHVSWAEGATGHASWMDRIIMEWITTCAAHDASL